MKRYLKILVPVLFLVGGCGLDNYDAPKSRLNGQIMYNDAPIGLRGTNESVQLQLYQDGYAFKAAIPVYVGQDGSFEAQLFDGTYKLVTRDNNGPWVNSRDTTVIDVKGDTQVVLQVTPYFTLSDVSLSLSGNSLNYAFRINQVASEAKTDYAIVVLSTTSFVDDGTNIYRQVFTNPVSGSVLTGTLDVTVDPAAEPGDPPYNEVKNAKTLYARIGVRSQGAGEAIYSDVIKLR